MRRRARKAAQRSRRFFLEPLEGRLLLSADLPASLLPAPLIASVPPSPSVILDSLIPAAQPPRQEMVVIDGNVPDYQQLVKDVWTENGGNRQFDVVVLDPRRDGIQQITDALAGHKGLGALHILSHGADGTVQLGSTWLNTQDLSAYASAIAGWKSSFADDADVLLYGCDVAAQEDGRAFVDALAFLTGADVAASEDLTGSAALGGNWNLEYQDRKVETPTLGSSPALQSWNGLLASLTVTTTSDELDGADGKISLREAIIAANNTAGLDEVIVPAGTYVLTGGELDITDDLKLLGPAGAGSTIIDGGQNGRVFQVNNASTVTFSGLTIQNGKIPNNNLGSGILITAPNTSSANTVTLAGVVVQNNIGGNAAIYNKDSNLTLTDSTVQNNQADKWGGGLYNDGGTANLTRVAVINNAAGTNAGGIYSTGGASSLNLVDVTLSGNQAPTGNGGAIFLDSGKLVLDRVTIEGNTAKQGGGIYVDNGANADATLTNVTISGNTATAGGGGIWTKITVSITNSTIAYNTAASWGGIRTEGSGDASIENTIFANNTGGNSNSALTSLGHNIDSGSTLGLVLGSPKWDHPNTDPMLGPLQNNGGLTDTCALLAGSPAIDAGTTIGAPLVDQRGYARDATPDIGAYEYGAQAPGIRITPIGGLTTTEVAGTATFTVVLTSQPTADVTIGLSSSDTSEGTVSQGSLTFTAANWNVAQTVTVTGVDDAVADGNIAYSIVTGAASSTDPNYAGLNPSDVAVTNTDNDTAGITVSAISGNTTEAGGTATFTVVLTSQPTADVTIPLASGDLTEGTVSTSSLTFTAATWDVAQTVTVTGVDDAVADGDIAYSILTGPAGSADPKYSGLNPSDVAVTNTDNDTAGITVSPTAGLTTTEAGGTASFTVVLTSQPTADVSIAVSASNPAEGTVSTSILTFTSANWNTAQTVTVTGVDDFVADGNIAYSILTAPAVSADGNYNARDASDVAVTNIDDDTAGITVSPISGNTTEAGGTATFTVVLASQPLADVTISLSSSDLTEGTVSVGSLTFTAGNWNAPQTITVTGVDDFVVDGDIAYSIVTGPAVSADPNYNGLNPADVAVTNIDNDTAGITVTPTVGLTTTEAGGTATFTVVLTSQPTADVTIPLASSDLTKGTVSTATLTFTAGNWNTAQTVTITGVDDLLLDGNQAYTIVTGAAVSTDGKYNGIDPADVAVTNLDNDTAGITVSPTSGLTTTEAGGTATFTVVLTSQPTADVTIPLVSSNLAEGTVSTASLTFTAATWNTPQTVTVMGVDDFVADGPIAYSIVTGPATSTDPNYNGLKPSDLAVTNLDNDTAGITVSPTSGLTTTEAGGTATFTVVLTSQPTADVTIGLSSSDLTEGTVSISSLTFTAVNWNTPQTVTVTGVDDFMADGDIAYNIVTAAASSLDANYNALNPPDVAVTNADNDTAGITVSAISGNTTEAGGTATFTVVLTSQPTADVTISLSSSNPSEGTVSTGSLTFTAANWSTPQTVTVTGVQDFINDGDTIYSVVLGAAWSFDGSYNGRDPSDVTLTNRAVPNVAPINTLPAAQSIPEDTELIFSIATGNAFSVSDADAGNNPIRVSLAASDGTLTLSTLSGLTIVSGTNGTGAVTFDGSITDINAALNGLVFHPAADFAGSTTVLIGTNDLGNTGTGGPQGSTGTVNITVTPVDDPPSITSNSLTIDQGGAVALSNADLSSSDPDNTAAQLTYTVSNVNNGHFEFVAAPGVAITSFTQAQVNGGEVRFVQNGSQAAPRYDVKVSDGSLVDGPRLASITFTAGVPPAVSPANDPAPNTNPPTGNTTPAPPPAVMPPAPLSTTPAAPGGQPSGVAPGMYMPNGPYAGPGQQGQTDRGQGEKPQGEGVRAETRDAADMNRGTLASGFMGAQAAGPRRAIAGIVRWFQDQLQAAKHGGFAELPGSRVEEVEKTLHSSGLVGELNRLREEVEQKVTIEQTVIRSTVAVGTGLSVGYVVWLLRGGLLLTSLLSSLPAWHIIDPWPVLSRFKRSDEEEEEEKASEDQVEHMFDKARTLMKRLRKTQSVAGAQPEASGSPTTAETSKMKKG